MEVALAWDAGTAKVGTMGHVRGGAGVEAAYMVSGNSQRGTRAVCVRSPIATRWCAGVAGAGSRVGFLRMGWNAL